MVTFKLITMALILLCLSACQSTAQQKLVCSQIAKHQIKTLRYCSLSMQFQRCRCNCFDFNSHSQLDWKLCPSYGLTGKRFVDYPVQECEGLIGFNEVDVGLEIRSNVKALFQIKENLCQ